MKKIPTIFVRDFSQKGAPITTEWHPDALWVRDGLGTPTVKWDGTACLWDGTLLWKRREVKAGDPIPAGFRVSGVDDETGKQVGWLPVDQSPNDQWHRDALANDRFMHHINMDGTYELIGPKVNGNKHGLVDHWLVRHGDGQHAGAPRTYDAIKEWLTANKTEGIVWHHPDGRMAKIKRRDLGLPW